MPIYSITIQAMIAKTYEVDGVNLEHAKEQAHFLFNSEPETSGTYGDEIIDYRLIEPEPEPEPETFVVSSIAELRDVLFDCRGKTLKTEICVQIDNTGKITVEPVKG